MLKYFEPIRVTMTLKLISPASFYFLMWLLGNVEWHLWLPLYFGKKWSDTARDGWKRKESGSRKNNERLLGKSPDETGLTYLNSTHLQNLIQDLILPPKAFLVITIPNESPFSKLLGHLSSVVFTSALTTCHFYLTLFLSSDHQLLGWGSQSRHL